MIDNSWISEAYLSKYLNFIYLKAGFDGNLSQEYMGDFPGSLVFLMLHGTAKKEFF